MYLKMISQQKKKIYEYFTYHYSHELHSVKKYPKVQIFITKYGNTYNRHTLLLYSTLSYSPPTYSTETIIPTNIYLVTAIVNGYDKV